MSPILLLQSDLNEQQRERFVSSMNIRQIAMPRFSSNRSVFPGLESLIQASRTKSGLPFSSLTKVKLRKESKDFGSLMRKQEKKDLQVFS